MANTKFIGHDVSVYSVQASGQDGNPQSGAVANYLGDWESVEITLTNVWSVVSSSDAVQPEKRWKMADFSGTCKGWISFGGSTALELFGQAQLIILTFKETNSGKTMVCKAGISRAHAVWGADNGKDDLDFEDVGAQNFGGGQTLFYS